VTVAIWVGGLLRRCPGRLIGTAAGIAVAVALLASLGAFLAHSQATMTDRAIRGVGVDWQVQVQPGADPESVDRTLRAAVGVVRDAAVGFGTSAGLSATTGGGTQTTGPAVVLGLPADYRELFPAEVRTLAGGNSGVLLAQQTAANLHAAPGDAVTIALQGLPPATVTVTGVVELPQADSLFQRVGGPVGAGPSAPPDDVLLLPAELWHRIFDPLAANRPDLVGQQIHVRLDHQLPAGPSDAFVAVTAAAHHVEAAAIGGAIVGDNLGAALDAARSDAAFALVLFLFLGLPGAVVAALLTATVAAAGSARRRGEQALLRARGASASQLVRLAGAEAAVSAMIGAGLGLAGAVVLGRIAFDTGTFGVTTAGAWSWAAVAAGFGMAIAIWTVLLPARRELRHETVTAGRASIAAVRYPAWARYGLDAAALIIAGLVFAATSSTGYQLVLAPEGVPEISVSYWVLAGPALLWIGAGLLIWRVADLLIGRGRPVLRRTLSPLTGTLAGPVSAGLARQRRPLVRAIVLLALAISYAGSTAIFNATYAQQAEVDARLTNGADVTVVLPAGAEVLPGRAAAIAAVPGVTSVEPLQHRFAYIGSDVQDLYGVRPETIASATALQDAYFSGGTVATLMMTLSSQPDSILVSAETVLDYQLVVGDTVNLRLVEQRSAQLMTVPFTYVGVANEFPTAPRDSFFVANAAYIAARTGDDAIGSFLVDAGGTDTAAVAQRLAAMLGTTAGVTDVASTRQTVGSSLTAVDLAGLTRVELTFALIMAVAAGGLVFGLGLAERRRTFAIVTALGATGRQLRGMISSEAVVLAVMGLVAGAACGSALSVMLVKVLTGVFDPPPAALAIPWAYLGTVTAATILALTVVTAGAVRAVRRPAIGVLREL
jgi:putative ABC transport system permease protein